MPSTKTKTKSSKTRYSHEEVLLELKNRISQEKRRLEDVVWKAEDRASCRVYEAKRKLRYTAEEIKAKRAEEEKNFAEKEQQAQEILVKNGISDITCTSNKRLQHLSLFPYHYDPRMLDQMAALHDQYMEKENLLSEDEKLSNRESVPLSRLEEFKRLTKEEEILKDKKQVLLKDIAIAIDITPELTKKVEDFFNEMEAHSPIAN